MVSGSQSGDTRLVAITASILFVLCAWPLLVVDVAPLQDLPNHLATVHVLSHAERYPEYVSNGYFKTNATMFAFMRVASAYFGLLLASKFFVALVLLVGSVAYPLTALRWRGREAVFSLSLFVWPLVHNWFVCMGMLDYALAIPLALLLLVVLDHDRKYPSFYAISGATLLAILLWYTHAFALLVTGLLIVIEAAVTTRATGAPRTLRLLAPLVPAGLLVTWSLWIQLHEPKGVDSSWQFRPVWELAYNAWSEWIWGFSKTTAATILVAICLLLFGIRNARNRVPFFGIPAIFVLLAAFLFSPYHAANWFYVNSRFLPFLWIAGWLRLPQKWPSWFSKAAVVVTVSLSLGNGFDYLRIARTWDEVRRSAPYLPRESRVLPLVFDRKGRYGENTWPMLHAWSFYVIDRDAHIPLVFAHSKGFPISYVTMPEPRFNEVRLEPFPQAMKNERALCAALEHQATPAVDCHALFESMWGDFWREATPRFDHLFLYGATPEVRQLVPNLYKIIYEKDELLLYQRAETLSN